MKRIETSKKILIFCNLLTGVATVATFIGMFMGLDISSIVEADKGIYVLAAAAHSFYFWKAKAENMQKYGQREKIEMGGEYDRNNF